MIFRFERIHRIIPLPRLNRGLHLVSLTTPSEKISDLSFVFV